MRLIPSVSYAVGIMLQLQKLGGKEIDRYGGREPVTADIIARGCDFPPRYLYRILRRLVDAKLLRGIPGPKGGYMLARGPEKITLLQIIEGVDTTPKGTVLIPVCPGQQGPIADVNQICAQSAEKFVAELNRLTLADLDKKTPGAAKRGRAKGRGK